MTSDTGWSTFSPALELIAQNYTHSLPEALQRWEHVIIVASHANSSRARRILRWIRKMCVAEQEKAFHFRSAIVPSSRWLNRTPKGNPWWNSLFEAVIYASYLCTICCHARMHRMNEPATRCSKWIDDDGRNQRVPSASSSSRDLAVIIKLNN